ncbi:MAG TPA: hypothetical protein VM389_05480 [Phycisphaerae bacterium]|nr:hypothetical protein [Phycisphaerae bacterium]HUU59192.1 hypothetical protein [Phycisphaerae bacterium]
MGYYCGLPPAQTEEDVRTAPARHAKLQAEHDARLAEVRADQARREKIRRALPWWRRLLCVLRWGCDRPDDAKWGEWFCRHCGRTVL